MGDFLKNEKEIILNKLLSKECIEFINKYDICSFILFGSLNNGEFNDESDVDLAVISHEKIDFDIILNMELYFEKLLKREIDLIDLKNDNLDLFVNINILNTGSVIYSTDNNLELEILKNKVDKLYKENENFIYFRKRDLLS